ncbi:MAG: hypothetical protein IT165_19790 [Bryobacterales bacterium]|nr:hypothetical protein [Bryobacterales bacterium]
MRQALLLLALAACLYAQAPTLHEEKVHGRDAWVLENGIVRIAALHGGGHLAEMRLLSPDPLKSVNPMRVPHYPTIDPNTYDPAKHDAIYGKDSHRWISSGYMGHLLCFPFYGPPSSADEVRAQLGNHGEAPIVAWHRMKVEQSPGAVTLWYAADLPKTQYKVERAITLGKGAHHIRVEEWVENLTSYDRPFQWMEHATFGPPFVEPGKTVLDASATRGLTAERASGGSLASNAEVHWPNGSDPSRKPVSLRPMQPAEYAGTYVALLFDPSRQTQFFTLYHPGYKVLIGYAMPAAQYTWLADWQENRSNRFPPWNGQVIARGLEFGNSPFAEGLRKAVERGSLFGKPAYQWIGANQRMKREFTIFLAEIPAGFSGVADVRMVYGAPSIVARK